MKKGLATRAVSLFLSAIMIFSVTVPVFAIEPLGDVPIIIGGDSSQTEGKPPPFEEHETEGENSKSEAEIPTNLTADEFTVMPFPWSNTMVDAAGNELPQGRGTQSVIECNWMKYKNPKMASLGEIPWLLVQINGRVAYCVDTFNHSTNSGTSFVEKIDYSKLSTGQKQTTSYIMRYGAKSVAQDTDNILLHMATQTLIWEIVDGEREPYSLTGASGGVYKDLVKRYPAIESKYNNIISNARSWGEIPSFAARREGSAPTHKLEGTGPYEAALENTNTACDMSLFNFTMPGVTSSISGNTLNVSSTGALTTPVEAVAERKDATPGKTYVFWFDPSGKDQTRTSPGIDPVPAYFKLSTEESTTPPEEEEEEYEIIINKYEKGTNIPLAGAQFAIKYLGGSATPTGDIAPKNVGKINSESQNASQPSKARTATDGSSGEQHFETSVTTDESGSVTVTVPYKGVYEIRETAPPANHKLDEYFLQTVIVNEDVPTASVDFHNEPYTGVRIQKIDAQTRAPLAGATFTLEQIDGDISRTGVSGADGTLYFEDLPASSYRVTEVAPPPNYHIAKTPAQTVELKANQTATLVFEDEPYTGVRVQKIDAQSKIPLAGATFKLEQIDGGIVRTGITGADGIVFFENLPSASYRVTEITPPPNYHMAVIPIQTVELTPDRVATVIFEDEPYSGFKIRKVDAHTGKGLAGAVFTIHVKDGELVGEYITDINGLIIKGDLPEGWYTIEEKQAPDGYLIDTENCVKDIYIRPEDDVEVVFRDFEKPKLLIQKIDELTGKPLAGAVFKIAKKDGVKYTEVTTDESGTALLEGLDVAWYVVTEIRSPNGYILDNTPRLIQLEAGKTATLVVSNREKSKLLIEKIDELTGEKLSGAVFKVAKKGSSDFIEVTTDETGTALLEELAPDWYVVTEIRSPNGYLIDNTPRNIQLEAGKTATLVITNQAKPGLKILKLDSMTKQPLQYAEFNVSIKNGKDLGNFTTDKDGIIFLENCEPAIYIITEITAPDGYHILAKPTEILVEWGKFAVVTLENIPEHPLLIKKVDSKTGNALSGAKFIVQKVNGEMVGEFESGRNGYVTITGLDAGFYSIKEIKAPNGYILNGKPKIVELKQDKPAVVEFENTPLQGLQIRKIDDVTGAPLGGVQFSVTKMNGPPIGTFTTDPSGMIYVPNLKEGWYSVAEIKAPDGYKLDAAPRNIELKADRINVLEYRNQPYPVLSVIKTDSDTGAPLAGVKFKLFDKFNRELGTFTTNKLGKITLTGIDAGKYFVQEVETLEGYVLDKTIHEVTLEWGKTTPLELKNVFGMGQIQIVKKSISYNENTKKKAGSLLEGAVFEVSDAKNNVVDYMKTDNRGVATSEFLPLGVYGIREIKAPNHYLLDGKTFYAEIKKHNDLIKFEVLNENEDLRVDIQKFGNIEAMPGDVISYDFKDISNKSTVELDEFYFRDILPTDALRLNKIQTGTWSERLTYKVLYKTNMSDYRTLTEDLSSQVNHNLDCSPQKLGLSYGEFVTEIKFEFGTVQAGFKQEKSPVFTCTVNADLPNEYLFTNCADVGGKRFDEWIISKDCWTSIVYAKPKGKLPKTGF